MPQINEKIRTLSGPSAGESLKECGRILRDGGLVVFPTETVYGIAAAVHSDQALSRLRDLKGRQDGQPFTLHLGTPQVIPDYVDLSKRHALRRLVRKLLPGPVTFIVEMTEQEVAEKSEKLLAKMRKYELVDENLTVSQLRDRLYYEHAIGLRCPDMPDAQRVLNGVEVRQDDEKWFSGVVATSANLKGRKAPVEVSQLDEGVLEKVDLVLDGGYAQFSKASTILRYDLSGQMRIEREGVYDARYLEKMSIMKVLFVCSGNTCRSPMAEGLAKAQISKLGKGGEIDVISAGTSTFDGMPASPEAVVELNKKGIDIANHRSSSLTPDMIADADWIFCMTGSHYRAVSQLMNWQDDGGGEAEKSSGKSSDSGKLQMLDKDGDVVDPIGSGASVYASCAAQIENAITSRFEEIFN